jgi:hypothetical protein
MHMQWSANSWFLDSRTCDVSLESQVRDAPPPPPPPTLTLTQTQAVLAVYACTPRTTRCKWRLIAQIQRTFPEEACVSACTYVTLSSTSQICFSPSPCAIAWQNNLIPACGVGKTSESTHCCKTLEHCNELHDDGSLHKK